MSGQPEEVETEPLMAVRQLIEVNGVRMNAQILAARGSEPHRTLVMLHGFTGSAAGWGSHLTTFAGAALRVIALDMLVTASPTRRPIRTATVWTAATKIS